jgi:hypothetical protein
LPTQKEPTKANNTFRQLVQPQTLSVKFYRPKSATIMSIPPKKSPAAPTLLSPISFADWDKGNFRESTGSFDDHKTNKAALAAQHSAFTRGSTLSSPLAAGEDSDDIAVVDKDTPEVDVGCVEEEYNDNEEAIRDDTAPQVTERYIKFVAFSPLNEGSVAGGNDHRERAILNDTGLTYLQPTPGRVVTSPTDHYGEDIDSSYAGPVISRQLSNDPTATEPFPDYVDDSEDEEEVISTAVEVSESGHVATNNEEEAPVANTPSGINPINTPESSPQSTSSAPAASSPPVVFRQRTVLEATLNHLLSHRTIHGTSHCHQDLLRLGQWQVVPRLQGSARSRAGPRRDGNRLALLRLPTQRRSEPRGCNHDV